MTPRNLLIVAAAVVVAGCVVQPRDSGIKPLVCTPGVCKVTVTITDCFAWDGIQVDRDPIVIGESQLIQWKIETADYTFAEDGVAINWDPAKTFSDPKRLAQGRMFQWHDTYKVKDKFKYTINVTNKYGVRCRPFDPWINNE